MMEKGYFHDLSLDELVQQVPLPNQMPKGIDFREVPPAALKSSTLESLISQNEDLMARLSVSLRKANQLEERNAFLESESSNYKHRYETLREQFLVLQEKDRLASGRSQQLLEENANFKNQFRRLEKIYAELFIQAQAFQRRVISLERYRAKIKRVLPAIQARAKRCVRAEHELQVTKQSLSLNITQSVNTYEAKLADVRSQIEVMRNKATERDQIFAEKLRIENQLVHDQRIHLTLREESERELGRLEGETAALRQQLKENLLLTEAQRQEMESLRAEVPQLEEKIVALRHQVESLQALWSHKQREQDQVDEKNRGLQKLNQTLSLSLNQQRKEIHQLNNELEKERFTAQERLKTLSEEIKMLRIQIRDDGAL